MICIRLAVSLFTTAAALAVFSSPAALAQGKIVCWKDAAGKVVGCGDKVPTEYLGRGTRELDKQGNVRKTGESAEQADARKAREMEQAKLRGDEAKRLKAQQREDDALLNSFTNVKEIDLKRDREVQTLNNFLTQQHAALNGATARWTEARKRAATFETRKKPLPPVVKEDLASAEREKSRVESEIAANEKAKADIHVKYAQYRTRFMTLKGISPELPAAAAPASTPAPAPASTPAPAKK